MTNRHRLPYNHKQISRHTGHTDRQSQTNRQTNGRILRQRYIHAYRQRQDKQTTYSPRGRLLKILLKLLSRKFLLVTSSFVLVDVIFFESDNFSNNFF